MNYIILLLCRVGGPLPPQAPRKKSLPHARKVEGLSLWFNDCNSKCWNDGKSVSSLFIKNTASGKLIYSMLNISCWATQDLRVFTEFADYM